MYINIDTWEMSDARNGRCVRIPIPMMAVVAPLLGGLFVLFLPFIGFVILAGFASSALLGLDSE